MMDLGLEANYTVHVRRVPGIGKSKFYANLQDSDTKLYPRKDKS